MGKEAARLEEIVSLKRMIQPRRFFPHDEHKHDRHPEQTKLCGAKVCAAKDP
jgi:hypothetical protein